MTITSFAVPTPPPPPVRPGRVGPAAPAPAPVSAPAPAAAPALLARDTAGTVWAHSNPAELYRWIVRRNDLLTTIAVVAPRDRARGAAAGLVSN